MRWHLNELLDLRLNSTASKDKVSADAVEFELTNLDGNAG